MIASWNIHRLWNYEVGLIQEPRQKSVFLSNGISMQCQNIQLRLELDLSPSLLQYPQNSCVSLKYDIQSWSREKKKSWVLVNCLPDKPHNYNPHFIILNYICMEKGRKEIKLWKNCFGQWHVSQNLATGYIPFHSSQKSWSWRHYLKMKFSD